MTDPTSAREMAAGAPAGAGRLSPAAVDATLKLAVAQHQHGNLALAEALYDQVLLIDDANSDALHLKGLLALARGSAAEALALIERACALMPQSALFQRSRADALGSLGRWPAAVSALEAALAIEPAWAEAHAALGIALAAVNDHPRAKQSFARATELAPRLAEAWCNLGALSLADKETARAITAFETALNARPDWFDALNGLGVALTETGRIEKAVAVLDRALAVIGADVPGRADALTNRAVALQALGQWELALANLTEAATLVPGRAAILRNAAKSLTALGRLEEAEAVCTRALAAEPADTSTRYERAFVRLLAGNIAGGFDDYRARPTVDRGRHPMPTEPLPADLTGRKLRLVIEQGLGEHLFFLRYAPVLVARGAELAVEIDAKLARVLAGHGALGRLVDRDQATPGYESILIGDLPYLIGAIDAAPSLILAPDPVLRAEMAERLAALGPAPYVALTWRAGIQDGKSLSKTVPLDLLSRALASLRGTLISLQRNPEPDEAASLARSSGRTIYDLSALNDDLARMLATLALIDDYVGVSNTNMHLRAGLGGTARVLIPHPPEFRWCARDDYSPWFPNFQLYRAEASGWDNAMARLAADLAASPRR
jgi:tetratricopeptide (TPR) repeat protein